MKVIGYRESIFTTPDNKTISGYNIFVSYPLQKGEGEGADRLFLTVDKLLACGYDPNIGDEVKIEYNRFGKPNAIYLV